MSGKQFDPECPSLREMAVLVMRQDHPVSKAVRRHGWQ